MSIRHKLRRIIKSFRYAMVGIVRTVKEERNMRIHLCAAFYVLWLMRFYSLSAGEKAAVYLTIALVISLELVNTAIEACVDLITTEYRPLAEKAKDAAAGAVLCSAVFAVIVAFDIFGDAETLIFIGKKLISNICFLLGFTVSVIAWLIFIFRSTDKSKYKKDVEK